MKIEHFAYQVEEPAAVAEWYMDQFGFLVKRAADSPVPVRFLADESGAVMVEIYNNPAVETPDYASMDPLILHLAFVCDDIEESIERLVASGATLLSVDRTPAGDHLAMLRDPWGMSIQLCRRAEPMV